MELAMANGFGAVGAVGGAVGGAKTGAAGAWLGYCEAKSAAEATWDYFAELF